MALDDSGRGLGEPRRWGRLLGTAAALLALACGRTKHAPSASEPHSESGTGGEPSSPLPEAGGAGTGGAGTGGEPALGEGGESPLSTGGTGALSGVGLVPERSASLVEVCRAYVAARCARVEQCGGPRESFCTTNPCPDLLFSDGSPFTLENALECARQWDEFECLDLYDQKLPECESWPGDFAGGESCLYDSQCEGRCQSSYDECGTCTSVPEGPNCGDVLTCEGLSSCIYDSVSGYYCDERVPHPDDLAELPDVGESCQVFCSPGSFCGGPRGTDDPTCVSNSFEAEVGAPCILTDTPGASALCGGDLGCRAEDDTCQLLPSEGEPCMVEAFRRDRGCRGDLVCVENTPGQCGDSWSCVLENGTCQRPGGPGTPCLIWSSLDSEACRDGEVCSDGVCFLSLELWQRGCSAEFALCEEDTRCENDFCVPDDRLTTFSEACGP